MDNNVSQKKAALLMSILVTSWIALAVGARVMQYLNIETFRNWCYTAVVLLLLALYFIPLLLRIYYHAKQAQMKGLLVVLRILVFLFVSVFLGVIIISLT